MHDVGLDGFLSILMSIWDYLTHHGFNIRISGELFTIPFSYIMIGLVVFDLVITLINKIFWSE